MNNPKPQEIYRHFKGKLYQIITLAQDSETGETMVVYQALYGEFKVYVRPLDMFMSPVDKTKYPAADQKYRFEKVELTSSITEAAGQDNQTVTIHKAGDSLEAGLMDFLDADSYEKRLEILIGLQDQVTDNMLTTMAVACDIELKEGPLQNRFEELKNCLLTLERFECNRLR